MKAIIERKEFTWMPPIEKWTIELFEEIALYTTHKWKTMHNTSITGRILEDRLFDLFDDLKRVSNPPETLTHQRRTHDKFSWETSWPLICLSVGIETWDPKLPTTFGEGTNIHQICSWLNLLPLFAGDRISISEVDTAIDMLDLLLSSP